MRSSAVPAAVDVPSPRPEMVRLVGRALVTPRRTPEYPAVALVKTVESAPNELPAFERVTKSPPALGVGRRGPLPARNRILPVAWVIVPVRVRDALILAAETGNTARIHHDVAPEGVVSADALDEAARGDRNRAGNDT